MRIIVPKRFVLSCLVSQTSTLPRLSPRWWKPGWKFSSCYPRLGWCVELSDEAPPILMLKTMSQGFRIAWCRSCSGFIFEHVNRSIYPSQTSTTAIKARISANGGDYALCWCAKGATCSEAGPSTALFVCVLFVYIIYTLQNVGIHMYTYIHIIIDIFVSSESSQIQKVLF